MGRWIAVGSDGNPLCPLDQGDVVVVEARRRETMGHVEDGELDEQSLQEVITGEELEGQARRTQHRASSRGDPGARRTC